MKRDFLEYPWSVRTLANRYFNIYKKNNNVSVKKVERVVFKVSGPGALLGYRAMHAKIRLYHQLNVSRALVYAAMEDADPYDVEYRNVGKKSKREKGSFTSSGADWVFSFDGHIKLMGFVNSNFPIAIYAYLDTAGRKLV